VKGYRNMPPSVYAEAGIHVTPTGNGKERVELGDSSDYRFDLEKRDGRWLIIAFKAGVIGARNFGKLPHSMAAAPALEAAGRRELLVA
jgi:hypothetical protein